MRLPRARVGPSELTIGQPKRASRAVRKPLHRRFVMAIRKLEKQQWHAFFDRVSKMLEGKQAEIEVAALRLGDQIGATWLPLISITYHHKQLIVEVARERLDHLITRAHGV